MCEFEIVDGCEDILFDEYLENKIREFEERLEVLELVVEELKRILLDALMVRGGVGVG